MAKRRSDFPSGTFRKVAFGLDETLVNPSLAIPSSKVVSAYLTYLTKQLKANSVLKRDAGRLSHALGQAVALQPMVRDQPEEAEAGNAVAHGESPFVRLLLELLSKGISASTRPRMRPRERGTGS
jgi:hypothetical protein